MPEGPMSLRTGVLALLLPALPFSVLEAQTGPVPEGTRVRVTSHSSDNALTGTVVFASPSELLVNGTDGHFQVQMEDVRLLERSVGRKTRVGTGFQLGLLAGGLIGALTAPGVDDPWDCDGGFGCPTSGYSRSSGAMNGALVGGAAGALIGLLIAQEEWAEISLSASGTAVRIPLF